MNSTRAGLAVSLGGVGSQTSKYMFVIVGLSVATPRVDSVISYDLFCFMAPSFFLLGVFRELKKIDNVKT